MHERNSAFSGSDGPRALQEDVRFLQGLLRRPREPAPQASVEGLQEVARVRLCLDRAADILAELRKSPGKSFLCAVCTSAPSLRFGDSGPGGWHTGPAFSVAVLLTLRTCFTGLASETVGDSPPGPGTDRCPPGPCSGG